MSLFNTLNTGATGLSVCSTDLSVIGDNIANINTVGFKAGRANFADLLPNDVGGLGGSYQIGMGARMSSIMTGFGQGSLDSTSSVLDLAVSGEGFFQLSSGEENYYTRDGSFYMDEEGFIVSPMGLRLQGYNAVDGTVTDQLGDLQLDVEPVSGQATSEVVLTSLFDATAEYEDAAGNIDTPLAALDIVNNPTTIADATAVADFTTSISIYDGLGVAHDVTVLFERTGPDTWSWQAVVDEGELDGSTSADDGNAFQISSGTMTFDSSDGSLISSTQNDVGGWNFEGAAAQAISFFFGKDDQGGDTDGAVSMTGEESAVTAISQDGYTTGDLTSVTIDDEGIIVGIYTNGESQALGQVSLANFASEAGLLRSGGNLYQATPDSGDPAMGIPSSGGRGSTVSYALEKSNVELEDQFVYMITAQRSYQANARVISTANETLMELVNLI